MGFLWDGDQLLVLSQPGAPKVRNLRANPKAALHLEIRRPAGEGDGDGGDEGDGGVLTLEGDATVDPGPLAGDERAAYVARYGEMLARAGYRDETLFDECSTVVRVRPTRARSFSDTA